MTGSPRLQSILTQLVDNTVLDPWQRDAAATKKVIMASLDHHRRITDAIAERKQEDAERAMTDHSNVYWTLVVNELNRYDIRRGLEA